MQHLPEIAGAADRLHLALNAQAVDCSDPEHQDIHDRESTHPQDERIEPFRVPPAQKPVQENLSEDRADDAQERGDAGGKDHERHRGERTGEALLRVRKGTLLLSRGNELLPRLHGDDDAGILFVEFLIRNLDMAPGRVI